MATRGGLRPGGELALGAGFLVASMALRWLTLGAGTSVRGAVNDVVGRTLYELCLMIAAVFLAHGLAVVSGVVTPATGRDFRPGHGTGRALAVGLLGLALVVVVKALNWITYLNDWSYNVATPVGILVDAAVSVLAFAGPMLIALVVWRALVGRRD